MKRWKDVLMILLCLGGLLYGFIRFLKNDESVGVGWMVFWGVYTVRTIHYVVDAEYRQQYDEQVKANAAVCKALFGRFAAVVPYGILIFFGIAMVLAYIPFVPSWVVVLVLILGLVYEIGLRVVVSKAIKNQSEH